MRSGCQPHTMGPMPVAPHGASIESQLTPAACIRSQRDQIKLWVSTVSILVTHLQTLNIVAKLRVAWPRYGLAAQ